LIRLRTTLKCNRAFTLIELIVVMVVMAILAGLSAIAYRGIASDMQMSSAINTVTAALDNARAIAIKHNRYVITVFRPRLDEDGTTQFIELVIAQWNGDSASANNGSNTIWTYDRFVPVPKVLVRTISGGINVAGPGYGTGEDNIWWASSYLPAPTEPLGALVGVLYSPEGRVVVRNAESGADRIWVDYNRDWIQTINATTEIDWQDPIITTSPWSVNIWTEEMGFYFKIQTQESEPFVSMTPILAVFNEAELRKQFGTGAHLLLEDYTNKYYCDGLYNPWDCAIPCTCLPDGEINDYDRNWLYTYFIHFNADRIQFNRYSGAVLK
jgi:prepilin-type N-terminal cleavage/methylation domain-containing protein